MTQKPLFILASSSPRRLQLLGQVGLAPDLVVPADIDETPAKAELPHCYAMRMAQNKARVVADQHPGAWILAADSVVACGRRILPKAEDNKTVENCLRLLSGRRHRVYGGIVLVTPTGQVVERLVQSNVTFKRLTDQEIQAYVQTGEGIGKAGGYAIQGAAEAFVRFVSGASWSNVIGLSVYDVRNMMMGKGYAPALVMGCAG